MLRTALLIVLVLSTILISPSLFAADFRIWNPKDGLPVRQGYHIEWFRSIETDTNGNICIVWADTRLGDRDIWAQLVTSDGTPLWGEEGKLIVSEYARQEDPHVFPDGNGNWIITWIDYRYDFGYDDIGDVYMQKIDSNGNPLWSPSSGIVICDAIQWQLWVQSFSDGNGGAVSIWADYREGQTDIYGQHVDENGNVLWENNGKKIAGGLFEQGGTHESANYTADTDGSGGIIFAWSDTRNPTNRNIYGNRVTADGELVWADSSGMPICTYQTVQNKVRLCPDGNGGCFVVWQDSRNYDTTDIDLYGQHINGNGTIDWETDGVPICNYEAIQQNIRIVKSDTNEAILVWEDKREDGETEDLYTQKISNNDGTIQLHWGSAGQELDGIVVCNAAAGQTQARLTPDFNGGVYLSWVDERWGTEPNNELFGQHIDANGNRDWGDPNGIIICDQALSQNGNIIRAFNNSSACFIWADYRLGSPALYYQIYDLNANEQLSEDGDQLVYGLDNIAEFPTITSSSGNTKLIVWEDNRFSSLGRYPYMQRVNGNTGEILDEKNGFSLLPGFPYGASDTVEVKISNLKSISNDNGDGFSVWIDNRNFDDPHIYIQKTNASGDILWGDRGTPVAFTESDDYEQDYPFLVTTNDGGVVVVYTQLNDDFDINIRAQRLNSDGQGQWSSEDGSGYQLNTSNGNDHIIIAVEKFSDGSILVVYKMELDQNSDIYAQRVLLNGENAWETPVTICDADHFQDQAKTLKIEDDILIMWEDGRRGGSILDIYGQIISSDGSLSLDVNGQVFVEEDNQQVAMSMVKVGNHFWMAWQDGRDGYNDDIYVQKYDFNGNAQLSPESGMMLGRNDHRKVNPKVISDGGNGLYIAWVESSENPMKDIYHTHLDSNGDFANSDYPAEGLPLTKAFHHQTRPVLVEDGEGGFISTWQDDRSTGKEYISNIYFQRVNDWTVSVDNTPDVIPEGWSLDNAYPNPFNPSTRIAFNVGNISNVTLTVYDILGREVIKLVDGKREVGNHIVNWDGRSATGSSVSSGTYFYRLQADDVLITKKMILMK